MKLATDLDIKTVNIIFRRFGWTDMGQDSGVYRWSLVTAPVTYTATNGPKGITFRLVSAADDHQYEIQGLDATPHNVGHSFTPNEVMTGRLIGVLGRIAANINVYPGSAGKESVTIEQFAVDALSDITAFGGGRNRKQYQQMIGVLEDVIETGYWNDDTLARAKDTLRHVATVSEPAWLSKMIGAVDQRMTVGV